jgi:prolyl oligopeptidase
MRYPSTRTSDVADDYHGTLVPDPYRWLENATDPEVRAWVEAQNAVTRAYLDAIPERAAIHSRLRELVDYERIVAITQRGGALFFTRNEGLQDQPVLFVRREGEEARVLVDPNALSSEGIVALSVWSPSPDGRLVAYALSQGGSDWIEWRVRDAATGEDLDDLLEWCKFSTADWTPGGEGFFYSAYDPPEALETRHQDRQLGQKLYFHRTGTPQSSDELVYARPDHPDWFIDGALTDDGRWLIVNLRERTATNNRLYVRDLRSPDSQVEPLFDGNDAQYMVLDNDGDDLFVLTSRDAPRMKIVRVPRASPENWTVVVPEAGEAIQAAAMFGDRIYVTYMKDATSLVRVYTTSGERAPDVELPGMGAVGPISGRRGDATAFFSYTDFLTAPTILRLDTRTGETSVHFRPQTPFDPSRFEVRQVFYASKDGTRVPMFLVHRKGLEPDGDTPALLYGYGGFNIPVLPGFSALNATWLEMGGLYAVANLRGGGEYGKEWHDAGRKLNKQNVFDDFIAAAEWLVANGYTRRERLAIRGGSNGGLLVGASITQRPDLFGAAIPDVGVLDMLRFNQFTIGYAWEADYGSPQDPEEFKALYAYSPLHNLRPGVCYPSTLIMTADTDDRVVPAHSYKFAAGIQAAHAGERPVLLRVETSAGHGAVNALSKTIDETADYFAFLVRELDMRLPQGF